MVSWRSTTTTLRMKKKTNSFIQTSLIFMLVCYDSQWVVCQPEYKTLTANATCTTLHTHIHTHAHTYAHAHTHACTHTHIRTCTRTCTHTHACTHTHTQCNLCTYTAYSHIYVCTYIIKTLTYTQYISELSLKHLSFLHQRCSEKSNPVLCHSTT